MEDEEYIYDDDYPRKHNATSLVGDEANSPYRAAPYASPWMGWVEP